MRERKAKCGACKVVLEWKGAPNADNAICPYCEKRMSRTTHNCLFPRITQTPPERRIK